MLSGVWDTRWPALATTCTRAPSGSTACPSAATCTGSYERSAFLQRSASAPSRVVVPYSRDQAICSFNDRKPFDAEQVEETACSDLPGNAGRCLSLPSWRSNCEICMGCLEKSHALSLARSLPQLFVQGRTLSFPAQTRVKAPFSPATRGTSREATLRLLPLNYPPLLQPLIHLQDCEKGKFPCRLKPWFPFGV